MRPSSAHAPSRSHSRNALSCYLGEIGAFPLLTHDEERELADRVRAGDSGAAERLICANLRFVVSVAKMYQHQGVALADLINEGNLGLVRAAEKFDGAKGAKFVSYAVWWIRRAIHEALADHGRAVRVPLSRVGVFHRIRRRADAMRQELGRDPTQREIAHEMQVSEDEVATSTRVSRDALSLDAPLIEGDAATLLDYLPGELEAEREEEQAEGARSSTVEQAMGKLRVRDAQVLRLYFGFETNEPMTLEDIGGRFGITRERVRQIKERALSRLRASPERCALTSLRECWR